MSKYILFKVNYSSFIFVILLSKTIFFIRKCLNFSYSCSFSNERKFSLEKILLNFTCPVGWGCGIYWLLLCRGVRLLPNEFPGYDTKKSDGKVLVMLELWEMRSIPSSPSLSCSLGPNGNTWLGSIYGLNRTNLRTYAKLNNLK